LKTSEKNSASQPIKPVLSAEARQDLKNIQEYISEEQESPKTALKVINKILDRIEKLHRLPNTGTLLSPKVNFPTNYRFAREMGFLIFYRNENNKIFVDRIIHGKRDYIAILFPEVNEES
jgi:plasmid stabilization system protein ParE